MSTNEKAPISNSESGRHYGSLPGGGPSPAASDDDGDAGERSLTFYEVGYEVLALCGRKSKVILTSCR